MTTKTKKTIYRILWAAVILACCVRIYFEAGPVTAALTFMLWATIIRLANVIGLQNDVLEKVKQSMLGTLMVDHALRDAAEESDEEQRKRTENKSANRIQKDSGKATR